MTRLIIALLFIPTLAMAGGLYNETTTPVAGSVVEYVRWPLITIENQLGGVPEITFSSERVKLYPDGTVVKQFNGRTKLKASDYSGLKLPLYDPNTGNKIGTYTPEQYYALTYSMSILSENAAANLCWTTNGEVVCP